MGAIPVFENGVSRPLRHRVLKKATIIRGLKLSETVCVMRNESTNGCELKLNDAEQHVPDEFLLYVPMNATAYRCKIRWRTGARIGVEFSGTECKPHWHYG